jgi:hypothetical protein
VLGKAQQWSHTPLEKSQHEKSQQKIMILTEKIDTREAKVKGSAIGWVSLVWRFQACSGMTSPSLPCVRIILASNATAALLTMVYSRTETHSRSTASQHITQGQLLRQKALCDCFLLLTSATERPTGVWLRGRSPRIFFLENWVKRPYAHSLATVSLPI